MRKQIKKCLATFCAAVMILGGTQLAQTQVKAEGETTAYLTFADSSWGDAQYWYDGNDYAVSATNAQVTGNGQYTVALDFSGTEAGHAADIQFLDVEISNGEAAYPNSVMTIDSVKINGEEVEVGATYTTSDDDIATRTNLYNEWVAEVESGRTVDGNIGDATATPIDGKSFTNIESIEVTFTLGDGVAFGSKVVKAKELPAEGTTAYLTFADNNWAVQYWFDGADYSPVVANNATVTGYGEYTVSLDFTGVEGGFAPDMTFMDVEVAGGEEYFPNSYMNIKSVKINGEEVELGNTFTNSDNDVDTRTNLYNTWVTEVTKGRSGDVLLSECTAAPVDGTKYTEIKTVECTFELVEGEAVEVEDTENDYSEGFNAFLMFSDGSGAWENYSAGVGTDMVIKGDGVYEVSLTAEQCGATGTAIPTDSGLVFLVDIEGLGQAMIDAGTLTMNDDEKLIVTDAQIKVAVFVDGTEVSVKSDNIVCGDIEENGRLRIDLYNAYDGMGTVEKPALSTSSLTPSSEIKVVFSLSGTGYNSDADTDLDAYLGKTGADEPTTEEVESADDKDGLSTTTIVIIIVSVVAVIGAVTGVVIFKKKKGNKE